MRANYRMQRLYVEYPLSEGAEIILAKEQAHYLLHVLRLKADDTILLFNGRDGEWLARCAETGKKSLILTAQEQTRPQPKHEKQLIYCFAPLKQARLDYMMQKAAEMGATVLQPVITQHTQVPRLNAERIRANITEAAEQCGILSLPSYAEPLPLPALLENWQAQYGSNAPLIFCDEAQIENEGEGNAPAQNPLPFLEKIKAESDRKRENIGLLIGPEGGFSEAERKMLYHQDFVRAIPLGPRIMRADTAAVAALAVIQAVLGDW